MSEACLTPVRSVPSADAEARVCQFCRDYGGYVLSYVTGLGCFPGSGPAAGRCSSKVRLDGVTASGYAAQAAPGIPGGAACSCSGGAQAEAGGCELGAAAPAPATPQPPDAVAGAESSAFIGRAYSAADGSRPRRPGLAFGWLWPARLVDALLAGGGSSTAGLRDPAGFCPAGGRGSAASRPSAMPVQGARGRQRRQDGRYDLRLPPRSTASCGAFLHGIRRRSCGPPAAQEARAAAELPR